MVKYDKIGNLKFLDNIVVSVELDDYTAFEVFPTDKAIPAGTADSLEELSSLFNWNDEDIQDMSNCVFTNLQYSVDVPAGFSVNLLVKSTINEGNEINIDWGDGITESLSIAESQYATHTYVKPRKYIVKVYGNGIYQLREINGLISRFMDSQLQFSWNLKNISSFTMGSLRLLKMDIPYEFNLKSISNIYGLFANCVNLKQFILAGNANIYEKGIFNKKFQSFGRLFKNCENLEVDISHLNSIFANWSEDSEFAECFLNCAKLTGTVNPKLFWNSFHVSRYIAGKEYNIYENCFAGCSIDIRNQVPLSWGGLSLMDVPEKSIEATLEIKNAQTEEDSTFTLKFGKAKYTGITVIWGDNTGTYQKPIDGTITISHNYQMNGTYNIKIFGVQLLTSFLFNADNSKRIITKVDFIQPLSISSSYRIMPNIGVQSLDLSNVNWKKTGSYSLGGCNKLENIELPNQLEELGVETLAWCSKLTSIVIPESVQTIASNTFKSCALLTNVKFNGKTENEIKSMANYDKWFSNGSTPPSQSITIWWNKLVDGAMTYGSFAYN